MTINTWEDERKTIDVDRLVEDRPEKEKKNRPRYD